MGEVKKKGGRSRTSPLKTLGGSVSGLMSRLVSVVKHIELLMRPTCQRVRERVQFIDAAQAKYSLPLLLGRIT